MEKVSIVTDIGIVTVDIILNTIVTQRGLPLQGIFTVYNMCISIILCSSHMIFYIPIGPINSTLFVCLVAVCLLVYSYSTRHVFLVETRMF